MKLLSVICLLVFIVFISAMDRSALAQEKRSDRATREAAMEAVVARYAETWNANDIRSWGELFTDDVDYVHRGGGWWRSNEENIAGHYRLHERLARQNQEMNLELTVESIEFLRPEIALVHVTSKWPEMGVSEGERGGIMTMVMLEEEGAWRIRALQNTLVSRPQVEEDGRRDDR